MMQRDVSLMEEIYSTFRLFENFPSSSRAAGDATTFPVPGMGDSISEGELKTWAVRMFDSMFAFYLVLFQS
jgi:hypothetical protein